MFIYINFRFPFLSLELFVYLCGQGNAGKKKNSTNSLGEKVTKGEEPVRGEETGVARGKPARGGEPDGSGG